MHVGNIYLRILVYKEILKKRYHNFWLPVFWYKVIFFEFISRNGVFFFTPQVLMFSLLNRYLRHFEVISKIYVFLYSVVNIYFLFTGHWKSIIICILTHIFSDYLQWLMSTFKAALKVSYSLVCLVWCSVYLGDGIVFVLTLSNAIENFSLDVLFCT